MEGRVGKPSEVGEIPLIHPCLLEVQMNSPWGGPQLNESLPAPQLSDMSVANLHKLFNLWIAIYLSLFIHPTGKVMGLLCQLNLLPVEGQLAMEQWGRQSVCSSSCSTRVPGDFGLLSIQVDVEGVTAKWHAGWHASLSCGPPTGAWHLRRYWLPFSLV